VGRQTNNLLVTQDGNFIRHLYKKVSPRASSVKTDIAFREIVKKYLENCRRIDKIDNEKN
jgi:hypothetical protein